MKQLQEGAREIAWLGDELRREIDTLSDTPYPHIHTFLTQNILHAIEKEAAGIRQALATTNEQKEMAS